VPQCSLAYPGALRPLMSNPVLFDGWNCLVLTNSRSCRLVGSKQNIGVMWLGCCCCKLPEASMYSKVTCFIAFFFFDFFIALPRGKGALCSRLASVHHLTCSVVAVRDPDFLSPDGVRWRVKLHSVLKDTCRVTIFVGNKYHSPSDVY